MDGVPGCPAGPAALDGEPVAGACWRARCSETFVAASFPGGHGAAWADSAHAARSGRAACLVPALLARAIVTSPLRAGQALPRGGVLWQADGRRFDLSAAIDRGPLVLVFHRGGWSPWCVAALREYQLRLDEFHEVGASVAGVSPDSPRDAARTAAKHGLGFALLSDPDDRYAECLGLGLLLPSSRHESHAAGPESRSAGRDRGARHAAVPATIVVGSGGRILLIDADPDWRWRLDPQRALDALHAPRDRAHADAASRRDDRR